MNTMMTSEQLMEQLGEQLVRSGDLTDSRLKELLQRAVLIRSPLDEVLLAEGVLSEARILETLANLVNIPFRRIIDFRPSPETVEAVPVRTSLYYHIIAIEKQGDRLTLAASRVPTSTERNNLESLLNVRLEWVLCLRRDIEEAIKHFYGLGAGTLQNILSQQGKNGMAAMKLPGEDNVDPSSLVREYIEEAIRMRASDIHLDPEAGALRLRFRVDGVMQDVHLPPGIQAIQRSLISCIKIMAQLDISERRIPQEGRMRIVVDTCDYDLRVSILPAAHGESINIRVLNRATSLISMTELGMQGDQVANMESLVHLPHGLVLFTGPTGSGKTTSLYSVLATIRRETLNIVTLEDPVEYEMDGITQIQINPALKLTFASGLRSVLRHDPDVILVGEIRDTDTADIAIRSAMTGHLVFSTLHTNSAASTPARLIDMGVEPYLVGFATEGIVAQRLIRRICNSCRSPIEVSTHIRHELERLGAGSAQVFTGRGCPVCKYTGYMGRSAILEVLTVTDAIRRVIVQGADSALIQKESIRQGMSTLRDNGWRLALQGAVSVEDVIRLTGSSI
jgi:type IV pilus assembly protein PilB